jgi:hypothetical protein
LDANLVEILRRSKHLRQRYRRPMGVSSSRFEDLTVSPVAVACSPDWLLLADLARPGERSAWIPVGQTALARNKKRG